MTDTDPEIYPLDVRALVKGQSLTASECEKITGVPAAHPRFAFEMMRLREDIMRLSAQAGMPLSVRIHGCELIINTDSEASSYHAKLAKEGERSIVRNLHHLTRTVDVTKLTGPEREEHDRRLRLWGMKAARLRGATVKGIELQE